MSEEIKEILEIFKKINEEYSVDTELDFEDYEIPNIYLKQFLDYITNLQEENIRLKELCDKYEEEHNTTFIEWQKDIKANKKTIEYIEYEMPCLWEVDEIFEDMDGKDYNTWKEYDENKLLNILKGDNK